MRTDADAWSVSSARVPLLSRGVEPDDVMASWLLKSTLQQLPTGPSRVDTVMIQNADHMYRGEEAQVAHTIANWAKALVPWSHRARAR